MEAKDLYDMSPGSLRNFFSEAGFQSYRGEQVFSWLYKGAQSFYEMKNLPDSMKEELENKRKDGVLSFDPPKLLREQRSKDGTIKFLFELSEGEAIESVFMKYRYGNTLCISSQLGCNMGCSFCASTIDGKQRNLSAGEMIKQVVFASKAAGERIGHIVIMGIGEPFDNFEEVSAFIRLANEEKGLGIGMRNITVSTCGIVPKIAEYGRAFPEANLAVSLHAAYDELRSLLMPVNRRYPLAELIAAVKDYTASTHRRVSFEYAMIDGVNDSDGDAEKLAALLKGMLCHVNLIPLNRVEERAYKGSEAERIKAFSEKLASRGIVTTVRRSLGQDIDAACGQLRRSASGMKRGAK